MEANEKNLEKKVQQLEERIKILEEMLDNYESVESIVWQLLELHPKLL